MIVLNPLTLNMLLIMRRREVRVNGCFHPSEQTIFWKAIHAQTCPGVGEFTAVPSSTPSITSHSSVEVAVYWVFESVLVGSILPIFQIEAVKIFDD